MRLLPTLRGEGRINPTPQPSNPKAYLFRVMSRFCSTIVLDLRLATMRMEKVTQKYSPLAGGERWWIFHSKIRKKWLTQQIQRHFHNEGLII